MADKPTPEPRVTLPTGNTSPGGTPPPRRERSRSAATPRFAGAHTAYLAHDVAGPSAPGDGEHRRAVNLGAVRLFTSKDAAMEFALDAEPPMKYVYWPFGMSLGEAIAQREADRAAKPTGGTE